MDMQTLVALTPRAHDPSTLPPSSHDASKHKRFAQAPELEQELKHKGRYARVQPGIALHTLRNAAARYILTIGPDPATHTHCTLGGMIGNNSCGVHALMAGKTEENVIELDVLTYDGLHMKVGE